MDCRIALAGLALLFAGAAAADSSVAEPPAAPPALADSQKPGQAGPGDAPADARPGLMPAAEDPPAHANPATAPLPAPADAGDPAIAWDASVQRFLPWLGVQYATSPQLGDDRAGYTSFNAFVPVRQWDGGLCFLNAAGFVNNFDDWGSNLGGGVRWLNRNADRILGGNFYWDTRDTGPNSFNQVGMGVESLGRYLDFRANGYVPLGNTQPVNAITYSDPSFFEHFILLGQHSFGQAALSGFDTEVGGTLPSLEQYGLRGYAGVYSYQGPNTSSVVGGHVRLEERLTDDLDLNLTVNSDPLFKTTVIFGAAFRFGGEKRRVGSSRGDVYSRLVDPVYRNDNITVIDQEITTPVIATNPCTNAPIIVDHAASYAAAGGDGTFEHPYNTLPQLQAGSHPGDILFVWANSTFTGQNITLQNNQRFLGEGLPYPFTATQGTFLLPRATAFTNQPVIQSAPGNAVTLANNNEVAGFVIRGAAQDGIFGSGVTDFYIHDNVITGSGLNGIVLLNLGPNGFVPPCMASGPTNVIANNIVNNNGDRASAVAGGPLFGEGIYLQGTNFTGNITGNTANGNGMIDGPALTLFDNSAGLNVNFGQGIAVNVQTVNANINGNTANGNGAIGTAIPAGVGVVALGGSTTFGQGIAVNAATFTGDINGNTANGNGVIGTAHGSAGVLTELHAHTTFGQGIAVNAATFTGDISGNTANGNGAFGKVRNTGVGFSTLQATTTFGQGIAVNAATFTGDINGNTADGNGAFGPVIGNGSVGFTTIRATTTFGQGIAVNAATFTGDINGNTVNGNGAFGPVTKLGSLGFESFQARTTFGQGIAVNAATFTGSISGNTANGNGAFGPVTRAGATGFDSFEARTTFGQGIYLQATTATVVLANNTLMDNGEFGPETGGATNITSTLSTTIFGQGMLLHGTGAGSFFASVDGNQFGNFFGTPGTDLLAAYTGSGKMGVELAGNTTTNASYPPPPFNYDFLNLDGGVFHLANNQGTTGGNGSATPANGAGTHPTAGPVPF